MKNTIIFALLLIGTSCNKTKQDAGVTYVMSEKLSDINDSITVTLTYSGVQDTFQQQQANIDYTFQNNPISTGSVFNVHPGLVKKFTVVATKGTPYHFALVKNSKTIIELNKN